MMVGHSFITVNKRGAVDGIRYDPWSMLQDLTDCEGFDTCTVGEVWVDNVQIARSVDPKRYRITPPAMTIPKMSPGKIIKVTDETDIADLMDYDWVQEYNDEDTVDLEDIVHEVASEDIEEEVARDRDEVPIEEGEPQSEASTPPLTFITVHTK
jgi:hypothetical protein